MKKLTEKDVAILLATNDEWLERAILALYRRQIYLEKKTRTTYKKNEVGFQVADSVEFSKFAEKLLRGEHLTGAEKASARKLWFRSNPPIPRICKYRKQILHIIKENARKKM